MFDIILATTKNGGIGLNGRMAWRCKKELTIFRKKTESGILIVGRKTAQSLPKLENRMVICVSKNPKLRTNTYKNVVRVFDTFESALAFAQTIGKKIFIAGGAKLYNLVFSEFSNFIDTIHLSVMQKDYLTDVSVEFDQKKFLLETKYECDEFTHYTLIPGVTSERDYLI